MMNVGGMTGLTFNNTFDDVMCERLVHVKTHTIHVSESLSQLQNRAQCIQCSFSLPLDPPTVHIEIP